MNIINYNINNNKNNTNHISGGNMTKSKDKNNDFKDLIYSKINIYKKFSDNEISKLYAFAEKYKTFLNVCKTERECCKYIVDKAREYGYKEFHFGDKLKDGDKRFFINRDKGIILFKIGSKNLEKEGIRIIVSHIDAPRIDIKQIPVYESDGFCYFKTHYYGGIKKYQWACIPLSLHGVVILKNGEKVEIHIGEKQDEPVFYISDLLPHLSKTQMEGKASDIISGEQLNIIVGSIPLKEEEQENIKLNILKLLYDKYKITEEDFVSAELSATPAYQARDVGFDKALIGGYGHDDRSCAFSAMEALFDVDNKNTSLCIFVDKEEIGSEGNTGIKSKVYEDLIDEICVALQVNSRQVRGRSICLSADVTACYDPNFESVFDKKNSAMISCGACMNKFSGSAGKSDSSDASAETVAKVRKIFDDNKVIWQCAELGKVDIGGGGTVAKFIAQLNIDTVDIGVPVISMHSPYELISKADLYSMYQLSLSFLF